MNCGDFPLRPLHPRKLKRNYPGLFAYVQKLEVLSGTILDWNNKPPRSIAQKAEAGERGGRGRARKSQG